MMLRRKWEFSSIFKNPSKLPPPAHFKNCLWPFFCLIVAQIFSDFLIRLLKQVCLNWILLMDVPNSSQNLNLIFQKLSKIVDQTIFDPITGLPLRFRLGLGHFGYIKKEKEWKWDLMWAIKKKLLYTGVAKLPRCNFSTLQKHKSKLKFLIVKCI